MTIQCRVVARPRWRAPYVLTPTASTSGSHHRTARRSATSAAGRPTTGLTCGKRLRRSSHGTNRSTGQCRPATHRRTPVLRSQLPRVQNPAREILMADLCAVCQTPLPDPCPHRLHIGNTTLECCSWECLKYLTDHKQRFEFQLQHIVNALGMQQTRPGADEQRGWKIARWWNQFFTHRRHQYDQWKTAREFLSLQRKLKRRAR